MKKCTGMAGLVATMGMAALVAPATAGIVAFNGTATALATPVPDASCAPLPFRGVIPASDGSGTSNLGSFTYSHNVCTAGPPVGGPVVGTFQLNFGGSLLSGLLNGTATPTGTMGLFNQNFTFTIESGTGFLTGATGSFTNVGTVDTRRGLPSTLLLTLQGTINTVDVPEPPAVAMLLVGFALVARRGWIQRSQPLRAA